MIDLKKIANRLKNLKCPEHNQTPKAITVTGNKIQIESCCKKFSDILEKERDRLIEESFDDSIDDALNKII